MKQFLKKRWHRIPVALVSAILVIALVAGGAFAAYPFLTANLEVEVEEAMVVAIWPAWDNLEPYGSVDDVEITLTEISPTEAAVNITTIEGYAGAGFVAGEFIVIPVNFRNAGDGSLNLSASVTTVARPAGGNLALTCSFEENAGNVGTLTVESGQQMCREYKATGAFTSLNGWTGTIESKGGKSGSAVVGAQVLFVRVSAPGDVVPGNYTFTVTLGRS